MTDAALPGDQSIPGLHLDPGQRFVAADALQEPTDRINFTRAGSALSAPLSWSSSYGTTTDLWAPDVSFHNGHFKAIDGNLVVEGGRWCCRSAPSGRASR